MLWHLLVHLFNYDYTLEESGVQASQETNQQEVANNLAKLSLVALSRLGGYTQTPHTPDGNNPVSETNGVEGTPPENPTIRKSLAAMLTPYISRKLATGSAAEVRCTGGYESFTYINPITKLNLPLLHLGVEAAEQ